MAGHKWGKGTSGNPGGRPRLPDDLKKSCQRLSLVGLKRIEQILRDPSAKPEDITRATKLCMEYGYGKPVQPIGGEKDGEGIVVNIVTLTNPEEVG